MNVVWTASRQRCARALYRRGMNAAQVAERMGMSLSSVQQANMRHGMSSPPPNLMLIGEFMLLTDLARWPAMQVAQGHGLLSGRWMHVNALDRKKAMTYIAALNAQGEPLDEIPDGYYTATQLAELWNCSQPAVHRRVKNLPYLLARPVSSNRRRVKIYDLRDVSHLRPAAHVTTPRGMITTAELAEVLHIQHSRQVHEWLKSGLTPAGIRKRDGSNLFHVKHVVQWLLAQSSPLRRGRGRMLQDWAERNGKMEKSTNSTTVESEVGR